jgi:hypothetical protein
VHYRIFSLKKKSNYTIRKPAYTQELGKGKFRKIQVKRDQSIQMFDKVIGLSVRLEQIVRVPDSNG